MSSSNQSIFMERGYFLFGVPRESGDPDLQGRGLEVHPGGSDCEAGVVLPKIAVTKEAQEKSE